MGRRRCTDVSRSALAANRGAGNVIVRCRCVSFDVVRATRGDGEHLFADGSLSSYVVVRCQSFEPTTRDLTRRCICVMHRSAPLIRIRQCRVCPPSSAAAGQISIRWFEPRPDGGCGADGRVPRGTCSGLRCADEPRAGDPPAACSRPGVAIHRRRCSNAMPRVSVAVSVGETAPQRAATSWYRPSRGGAARSGPCTPSFRLRRCSQSAAAKT